MFDTYKSLTQSPDEPIVSAEKLIIVPEFALNDGSNNQTPFESEYILESTPLLTPSSSVIPPPIAVKCVPL